MLMQLLHFLNVPLRCMLKFVEQVLDFLFVLVDLGLHRYLLLLRLFGLRLKQNYLGLFVIQLLFKLLSLFLQSGLRSLKIRLKLVNMPLELFLHVQDIVFPSFARKFFLQSFVFRN